MTVKSEIRIPNPDFDSDLISIPILGGKGYDR